MGKSLSPTKKYIAYALMDGIHLMENNVNGKLEIYYSKEDASWGLPSVQRSFDKGKVDIVEVEIIVKNKPKLGVVKK